MATRAIPAQMKQLMVKKLSNNYREATELVQVPVPKPGAKQILIRMSHFAINASDILFSAGNYTPGKPTPYPAGMEGMGDIALSGAGCKLKVGQVVVFSHLGCFGEYALVNEEDAFPVPSHDPVYMNLIVSATTAATALEKKGKIKKGDTVLVTAAAGATGQFVVQLAKLAGCHVIGTCSSEEKAAYLKSIGCDRPVIYTKESLNTVLMKEYPNGIDVAYESVGNELFDIAFRNLKLFGRIIVIGAVSGYAKKGDLKKPTTSLPLPFLTVQNSVDLCGFFMPHYLEEVPAHMERLIQLYTSGQLKMVVDNGKKSDKGPFKGFPKIYDAIDYLFAKKSIGKVVVEL